jgi:DNA gyrase subunit A
VRVVAKYAANKEDQTWRQAHELFFVTRQGTVKRTALSDFQNVRKGGIIAITLDQGDDLVEVRLTNGSNEIVLITREGMSIRFAEDQVRSMGRNAAGVKGIELEKTDAVVAVALVEADATLLVAGENGIGKRTSFEEYRTQSRGGKGIITMKTGEKTGNVVGALTVRDSDEIMLITGGGQMVRIPVAGIREAGRNTQGVKLIDLAEKDRLQGIAPVISEKDEETAGTGEPAA